MALLHVLKYPDKRLRKIAQPVTEFDGKLKKIVDDMFETMYDDDGAGLAATQVNIHQRIVVMDKFDAGQQPMVLINHEIVHQEGKQKSTEGCLSVPGIWVDVERAAKVVVKAYDVAGKQFEFEATERLAVCVQHELDHLNGKLLLDRLSPLKRKMAIKKLEKMKRRDVY